jgi:type II secretory pathway pseudopilin PulG
MSKNQKGFSVVEVLLILVLVGIIGFVGWYIWQGRVKENPQSSLQSTSNTASTAGSDIYAGWNTYKSPVEGFSIKYPADWTIMTGATNSEGVSDSSLDAVTISGPNDFSLSYDIIRPTTSFSCANCSFTVLDTIELKDEQPGYIVISSNTYNDTIEEQQLSISKSKTYDEQSDQGWPYYQSYATPDKYVRWTGAYPGVDKTKCSGAGCEPVSISLSDFQSRPEVKVAEQILQSLTY